ncbi:hypothetical protein [Ruania zhangjianzhongii]|uniref:hypothetical protein n=1 Tax=Ruania zhangjianzhongii TaxID=2603206 RepID=UPI0011CBB298|nr:hypothetical protein [Ruania zhangjianzhongii]
MWWFAVWTVLVLGALACFVLLALHLWRHFKALMAQLSRSGEVFERLDSTMAELDEQFAQRTFTPDLSATEAEREVWRQRRRDNLSARAERVQARRSRTLERWRAIGLPF